MTNDNKALLFQRSFARYQLIASLASLRCEQLVSHKLIISRVDYLTG